MNDINNILNKVYDSVENEGFSLLDDISCIDTSIFNVEPLKIVYSNKTIEYVNLLLNTIVFGYIIYYILKMILSMYGNNYVENMYMFFAKIIIFLIISNNSYEICKEVITINQTITELVDNILEDVSDKEMNYKALKTQIDELEQVFTFRDKISLEGIKEFIICAFSVNMMIVLSIRYVLIIFCIIVSPFCIISYIMDETRSIFYIWIKVFILNLSIQYINKIIIFIPVVSNKEKLFSIIFVGSIIILYKINLICFRRIYEKDK